MSAILDTQKKILGMIKEQRYGVKTLQTVAKAGYKEKAKIQKGEIKTVKQTITTPAFSPEVNVLFPISNLFTKSESIDVVYRRSGLNPQNKDWKYFFTKGKSTRFETIFTAGDTGGSEVETFGGFPWGQWGFWPTGQTNYGQNIPGGITEIIRETQIPVFLQSSGVNGGGYTTETPPGASGLDWKQWLLIIGGGLAGLWLLGKYIGRGKK